MKRLFFISLLFVIAASTRANVTEVQENDTIYIPIIIDSDNGPVHHAPIHQDVYGVVNQATQSLSVSIAPDVAIVCVRIYKNGQLVLTENMPTLIDNTLYYNLSSAGNGIYTIVLETDDIVYSGTFNL